MSDAVASGVRLAGGFRLPWRWSATLTEDALVLQRWGRRRVLQWVAFGPPKGFVAGWSLREWRAPYAWEHVVVVRNTGLWRWSNITTWFSGVDPAVAVAFVQYLAATPAAQRVLAHPRSDIPTLLRSARSGPTPRALSEPLVLSSYCHVAIAAALDVLWPRRFGGYPVAGEPRPTEREVMDLIRQRSPHVVASTSEARLHADVVRQVSIGVWPFSEILSSAESQS